MGNSRTIIRGTSIVAAMEAEPDRKLDTSRPAVQYIRRSTETQKNDNLMSLVQQDKKLGERLLGKGFATIVKIDTDDGTSGQKLLEDRAGLTYLYDLIKGRKLIDGQRISALAAHDASRLWRDPTHVWFNDFIQLIIKHDIPVIFSKRTYWPGDPNDMEALRKEFEGALESLKVITDRANPGRLLAVEENGSYGGHALPIGYYVVGIRTDRHYTVYEPHRELIVYLFERFKALNGNTSRLLHELDTTGFHFPEYELDKQPHIELPYVKGVGYFIKTPGALKGILTNVAYLGWYTFTTHEKAYYRYDEKKERRVKVKGAPIASYVNEQSHEPIVDRALFSWCYEHITGETLEGVTVVQRPERRYGVQTNAVLDGVLVCGANPVYAMANANTYVARSQDDSVTYLVAPIADVDRMFGQAMNRLLHAPWYRDCDELNARIREAQCTVQAQAVDYQSKLAVIDAAIQGWLLDKQSAREKGYKAGLDEANEQLATLERQRADIEASMNRVNTEASELSEATSLVDRALHGWTRLPLCDQRRLVRLLVTHADITEATPHIVKLVVSLGTPINGSLAVYNFRARGSQEAWSEQENETLRTLYARADRADILEALPTRTWKSTIMQAQLLGLERSTRLNSSNIPVNMCMEDSKLISKLGMDPSQAVWPVIDMGVQVDGVVKTTPSAA